ncbi:MAG: AAA family ATPase [Aeromicrobium sp.]
MKKVQSTTAAAQIAESARCEQALLFLGEPGIGKTQLLRDAAAASVVRAVMVSGQARETAYPLSGFAAFVNALCAGREIGYDRVEMLQTQDPTRRYELVQNLILDIRGLHLEPTLMLVDDIDDMDSRSQRLIGTLAGHLQRTGVTIVVTARPSDVSEALHTFWARELAPVSVELLTRAVVETWPRIDPSVVRILAGHAGGNPRVLDELLAQAAAERTDHSPWLILPPRRTPTTDTIAESVVASLQAPELRIMETVALAPLCHSEILIEYDQDAAYVVEDLLDQRLLSSHGLYTSVADPRVRSYLRWRQTAQVRRERSAELLAIAERLGRSTSLFYRSWTDPGDTDVGGLLEVAVELVALHRIDEAVEVAERALRFATRIQDHLPGLAALCEAFMAAGELVLTLRYGDAVGPGPATAGRLQLAALTLTAQLFHTQLGRDEQIQALVSLHARTDPEGAAALLYPAVLLHNERWETDETRQLLASMDDFQAVLGSQAREWMSAAVRWTDAIDGTVVGSIVTQECRPGETSPQVLYLLGRASTFGEDYASARQVLTLALNTPSIPDPVFVSSAAYGLIANEILAGEFHRARIAIEEWIDHAHWINRSSSTNSLIRAWYEYSGGRSSPAMDLLDSVIERAARTAGQALRARALALRGTIELLEDDPESAVIDLREVTSLSMRFNNPVLLRHWGDYLEACIRTERMDEAQAVHEALAQRLVDHRSRWGHLVGGRMAAMIARGVEGVALFEHAVREFAVGEQQYELGRTLACFADRHDELGQPASARRRRLEARAAFERSGAQPWMVAMSRHAGLRGEAGVLDQLSAEERQIVRLVQDGLRTRDIADALHLAGRTVELRLTHIYRTVGVRSRAQLIAELTP